MLNRAPYNTEVPEFLPSRDAPINSYVVRKYPCQEQVANRSNEFQSLTWKIQQPDSSLVWQSVKIVMPMTIQCMDAQGEIADLNVFKRLPCCNVALSQSPMNAFQQTTLSLNGRIFSEVNSFRDILDTCYRGIGAQAYGDNHSLKPIVQRNLNSNVNAAGKLALLNAAGVATGHFVQVENLEERTLDSAFTLLEHNGPFIERARVFQDQLSYDGKTWSGEISHLLELGPFQARARKGNTAVPYIKDFHLRLNFENNPSQFDVLNPPQPDVQGQYVEQGGRVMAPKLLEFATLPNFLHHGETVLQSNGWPADYMFKYTEKPYLEVTYTKHESGMRPYYNLRCFEHQYEQSNRFQLPVSPDSFESSTSLQRVTTRLLSLPTKVYVWADLADEWRQSFITGGVRRSCLIENLHLRVNQRPDVMFNPSQEDCYEMFRRHTNSSLEYGSWLKSPIYCFDMVDVGQSDMYSNDARVTWMEWDGQCSLTQLQMTEGRNRQEDNLLTAHAYDITKVMDANWRAAGWATPVTANGIQLYLDADIMPQIQDTSVDISTVLVYKNPGASHDPPVLRWADRTKILGTDSHFTEPGQAVISRSDLALNTLRANEYSLDGYIWAVMCTVTHTHNSVTHTKGDIKGPLWYVPNSLKIIPDQVDGEEMWQTTDTLSWDYDSGEDKMVNIKYDWAGHGAPKVISGVFASNPAVASITGKRFGAVDGEGNPINNDGWCPGIFAYEIDADGIRNVASIARGGFHKYGNGGYTKHTSKAGGIGANYNWVCFNYREGYPTPGPGKDSNAATKWAHYRATVAAPGTGGGPDRPPLFWAPQVADALTQWGSGYQKIHVQAKGKIGTENFHAFGATNTRLNPHDNFGAQLQNKQLEKINLTSEEYRMKVLYEYGNCQYQFAADASPTKVIPNLVPVQ